MALMLRSLGIAWDHHFTEWFSCGASPECPKEYEATGRHAHPLDVRVARMQLLHDCMTGCPSHEMSYLLSLLQTEECINSVPFQ